MYQLIMNFNKQSFQLLRLFLVDTELRLAEIKFPIFKYINYIDDKKTKMLSCLEFDVKRACIRFKK